MTYGPSYSSIYGTELLDELVVVAPRTIQARSERKQKFACFLSRPGLSNVLCESDWLKEWYKGLEKGERHRFRRGVVGVLSEYVDYRVSGRRDSYARKYSREMPLEDVVELIELIPINDGFPLLRRLLDLRECFMDGLDEIGHRGNVVVSTYARHDKLDPYYWVALAKDAPIGTAISSWIVLVDYFPDEAVRKREIIKVRLHDEAYAHLCDMTWEFSLKDSPLLSEEEGEIFLSEVKNR